MSKFPIINSTHYLLPSPHGELAPGKKHIDVVRINDGWISYHFHFNTAIHATLDMWGTHVNVIVSHNGQEEDPVELSDLQLLAFHSGWADIKVDSSFSYSAELYNPQNWLRLCGQLTRSHSSFWDT
jgi:hypothetical protein